MGCLTPMQQQWLAGRLESRTYPSRTTIYQPTDPAGGLYFVQAGKVKVETTSGKGDWLLKNICANGDFFGAKALLEHSARGEFARTLRNEAVLLFLPNFEVNNLMAVNFEFSEKVFGLVGRELIFMEERAADITGLSARERFIKFVLRMVERFGKWEGGVCSFNSQLTQEEIGTYIGTGRQTVTELLGEFQSKGLLEYSWGRFFIQKMDDLREA